MTQAELNATILGVLAVHAAAGRLDDVHVRIFRIARKSTELRLTLGEGARSWIFQVTFEAWVPFNEDWVSIEIHRALRALERKKNEQNIR